jgi:hypothetical protein
MALVGLIMRDEICYVATLNKEIVQVMAGQGCQLVYWIGGGNGSDQDPISMRLVVEVARGVVGSRTLSGRGLERRQEEHSTEPSCYKEFVN